MYMRQNKRMGDSDEEKETILQKKKTKITSDVT